ncbi:EsaB/YukD family protein [Actinacidiphila oryziradicis]|uniref:EccD-like transmembrane domain-containing protein n=1 Tax=Actinacidiphila oryziradicis TaxID=2571141 RepID=A0A4V6WJ20_9ACTN|nr:EsaB/YukD family protein [Actinacidiphila oryziradicis]TKA02069.1 hypothetical protein FCI23_39180 [Actinacidiphila oryziradicis]
MDNERCHVTVVGTRRRVDLAVPAHAAIAEYTPALLKLCGQEQVDDTFPPAWSLALPGARPFAPEASLVSSGVADGATLYLRDCAAGEFDAPIVTDLDEVIVAASQSGVPWDARHRAVSALVLGLLCLIGGFAALIALVTPNPAAGAGTIVCGFGLALLGWQAGRRSRPLLLGARLATALSAVPLVAMGADALPVAQGDLQTALAAASLGAVVGALAARLAVPHVTTLIALGLAAVAVPVTVVLAVLHATLTESAAVVAVVMLAVLSATPTASGYLAAMAVPSKGAATASTEEIPWLVGRGTRVLIGINFLCSVLLAACSVVLGVSDQAFAVGLSACLGLALVLRSGQLKLLAAVLPPITAGVVALATTLAHAPGAFGLPAWAGPVAVLLAGALMAFAGLAWSLRAGTETDDASWTIGLARFLCLLSVPLAVGVFGVFTHLLHLGESL